MQPLKNYESNYTINQTGEIKNVKTGRILRPVLNPQNGYLYVSLWSNGEGRIFALHRLVGIQFIPNPDNKPELNHIDSNRANPNKTNLEWVTRSENMLHAYKYGNKVPNRKLARFQNLLNLELFLEGQSLSNIAKQANCGLSRLSVNLRKLASELDLLDKFNNELILQKQKRNTLANADKKLRIAQYTKTGEFIDEFESLNAAAKKLKKSLGSISNALNPNHPQQYAYGFLWKFQ